MGIEVHGLTYLQVGRFPVACDDIKNHFSYRYLAALLLVDLLIKNVKN